MINKKSIAAIVSNLDKSKFLKYDRNGEERFWMPIFEVPDEGNFLGLNDHGEWVCGKEEWIRRIDEIDNSFMLLPILGMKRKEFVLNFKEAVVGNGIPETVMNTFSFDNILIGGLQSYGDDFNKAVAWLDDGYPVDETIASICDGKHPNKIGAVIRWKEERLKTILSV